jgi:hypothetical protein
MKNLALEHFHRVSAARSAPADQVNSDHDTTHESVLRALAVHKSRLRLIQSVESKIEYKRTALPDIIPWVVGVLESDRGGQDPVVVHAMTWLMDVGQYEHGLDVGAYVLRHGLQMPDEYKRPPATVIAEIIADDALKAMETGGKADVRSLREAIRVTGDHDMHDQVRAKLHKALGFALLPAEMPSTYGDIEAEPVLESLSNLQRAFALFANVGVKKPMERAQRYADEHERRKAAAQRVAEEEAQRAAQQQDTKNNEESERKTDATTGPESAGDPPAGTSADGDGSPPADAKGAAP